MKKEILVWLFVSLSTLAAAQDFVKHEIIVMLQPDFTFLDLEQDLAVLKEVLVNQYESIDKAEKIELKEVLSNQMKIALLEVSDRMEVVGILPKIRQLSSIKAAQLNYIAQYRQDPNDDNYEKQWYLRRIQASDAWNTTTGGTTINGDTIAVFVIDEGFDVFHEDLEANIWINKAETPNNGIDDDNNGFVDDVRGWNLSDTSGTHALAEHGTRVAGIIGGVGNNNIGISGVNWNVKLIPFSIALNQLTAANILKGYDYALALKNRYSQSDGADGAFIVATNFSGGFVNRFPEDMPIFCEIYNTLGIAGILNVTAAPNGVNYDVQTRGDVPTLCSSPYLITVTGIDSSDIRSGSFGNSSVDLAAPAQGIFTTEPLDNYGDFRPGTSFAAPQVAGAIALLYSFDNLKFGNDLAENQLQALDFIKAAIFEGVDKIDTLSQATVTGGVLNLSNSLTVLEEFYQGWNSYFDIERVYPNPVDNQLIIEYNTPEVETLDLLLFNASGQIFLNQKIEVVELGFRRFTIDVSSYPAGVYFMMLKNTVQTKVIRILVY